MSSPAPAGARPALLAAARAELAEVGVDRLSLRAVARRAGVSHAAPGYVFGGMTGLLTALAAEGFDLLATRLEEAGDIASSGEAYVGFAASAPELFTLMFRTALLDAEDPALREAQQRAFGRLTARAGTAASPQLLWALAHGAATLRADGQLAPVAGGEDGAVLIVRELARLLET